jgi:hypothetical protein
MPNNPSEKVVLTISEGHSSGPANCDATATKIKDRQSCRIRELRNTLVAAGFGALDEQAKVLGLCRSTTWSILKSNHKGSGLSATIVNRIWRAPQLPSITRAKILQYVREKSAGIYGHSEAQQRRFVAQLSAEVRRGLQPDCSAEIVVYNVEQTDFPH